MDGCGKLGAHLLEGEFADYVLGHELVLQAVVDKVFCRNRFVVRCQRRMGSVNQPFDLLYHTFFESGIQALVNLCISDFSAYQGAYVVSVFRKIARALDRMFGFVNRYLQSADEALAGVVVGVVVQRLQRGQLCNQLFIGFLLKFLPQLRIRRDFRQGVAAGGRFYI